MSFEQDIANGVNQLFKSTGDLVKDCVIKEIQSSTAYDAAADTNTRVEVNHTCKAILARYKEKEIDGTSVRNTDQKAIVQASTITPTYLPTTNDQFVDQLANTYSIETVGGVPGDSIFILQIRLEN